MQEICYACDNLATSQEHCPPRCFFPKNERVNLITVPACSEHNNEKSDNDEWVRLIIAALSGEMKLLPVITRSILRKTRSGNPSKIQNHILDIINQVIPNNLIDNNNLSDYSQYRPYDMLPGKSIILRKHLELIARGIMYHENRVNFKNTVFMIQSDKIQPLGCDANTQNILDLISDANRKNLLLGSACEKGDNKNIFSYKINKLCLMNIVQLQFYQKVVINIIFYPYPNKFINTKIGEDFLAHLSNLINNTKNYNKQA